MSSTITKNANGDTQKKYVFCNMSFALWSMIIMDHSTSRERYKINSRMFETIKIQVAAAKSELHKGKIVSAETKQKMSDSRKAYWVAKRSI